MRATYILGALLSTTLGLSAPIDDTNFNETLESTEFDTRNDQKTICLSQDPKGDNGIVPTGSALYYNIYIKGQDLMQKDDHCANSALKMRIKQQSACKALTNWKCKYNPKTKETYATFFEDIFCGAKPMVTAVEASTDPKIKTSCIHVKEKNAGLGEGVDAAVAGIFNALGGAISKGK